MNNKIRCALAVLAVGVSGAASAHIIDWGTIAAPDSRSIGNSFQLNFSHLPDVDLHGNFSDRYDFSLTNPSTSFDGTVFEQDVGSFLSIDVQLVSLSLGGSAIGSFISPNSFSFANLGAGSYSFFVSGHIGLDLGGFNDTVSYSGEANFTTPDSTAVPEPGSFVLAGISLLGLAFAMRRRLFN